jgi:glucokinase
LSTKRVNFVNQSVPLQSYLIGLDIGGTKIETAVAKANGNLLGREVTAIDVASPQQVVRSVVAAIEQVLEANGLEKFQVAAAGAGVPGQIEAGNVRLAVNLNLENYPLAQALSAQLGFPIYLENDVRVAALGAFDHYAHLENLSNLAFLSIGTGIGAGLILDGRVFRGSNGLAGEIGHTVFDPDGPQCKCGMRGCLEALAAGPALALQAQQAVQAGEVSILSSFPTLDSRAVYQAFRQEDPLAGRLVRQASAYLAQAIQWIVMAYDVDKVVLGGGVSHDGSAFLQPVLDELAILRAHSGLARQQLTEQKIALFPPDLNAGLLGAVALAKMSLLLDAAPEQTKEVTDS